LTNQYLNRHGVVLPTWCDNLTYDWVFLNHVVIFSRKTGRKKRNC